MVRRTRHSLPSRISTRTYPPLLTSATISTDMWTSQYGPPGSGKTSIVHSLAGELELDIYIISLSKSGMDDSTLNSLISGLPEHCIALMEDIDAAFTTSLNRGGMEDPEKSPSDPRDPNSPDPSNNNGQNGQKQEEKAGPSAGSKITLSGLREYPCFIYLTFFLNADAAECD